MLGGAPRKRPRPAEASSAPPPPPPPPITAAAPVAKAGSGGSNWLALQSRLSSKKRPQQPFHELSAPSSYAHPPPSAYASGQGSFGLCPKPASAGRGDRKGKASASAAAVAPAASAPTSDPTVPSAAAAAAVPVASSAPVAPDALLSALTTQAGKLTALSSDPRIKARILGPFNVVAPPPAAGGGVSAPTSIAASAAVSSSAAASSTSSSSSSLMCSADARIVALDCEMVGVGAGGLRSELAQVVVVDFAGRVILETYVAPREDVTDYRTAVSGVRPEHLVGAPSFADVQRRVAALTDGKILVGHSLVNDLKCLLLSHSWRQVRDTATFGPLCYRDRRGHLKPRRLKHLAAQHLGIVIQDGEGGHEPAEDARAALAIYRKFRREWEANLSAGVGPGRARLKSSSKTEATTKGGAGGAAAPAGAASGGGGKKKQKTHASDSMKPLKAFEDVADRFDDL